MKTLLINGEILVPEEIDLKAFCEIFNRLQDENNFGFNGCIKDKTES